VYRQLARDEERFVKLMCVIATKRQLRRPLIMTPGTSHLVTLYHTTLDKIYAIRNKFSPTKSTHYRNATIVCVYSTFANFGSACSIKNKKKQ